jgi:hypothetical protein
LYGDAEDGDGRWNPLEKERLCSGEVGRAESLFGTPGKRDELDVVGDGSVTNAGLSGIDGDRCELDASETLENELVERRIMFDNVEPCFEPPTEDDVE